MQISSSYLQASGVICLLFAFLFAWLHFRHRDPGAGWFALSFFATFAIFGLSLQVPIGQAGTNKGASSLILVSLLSLALGLTDYLGFGRAAALRWRLASAAPMFVEVAWLAFGPIPRLLTHLLLAASLCTMSVMLWRAARREAGSGLTVIAFALLLHPIMLAVTIALHWDLYELKNFTALAQAGIAISIFCIGMSRARTSVERELEGRLRAQAALEQLNHSLENRVTQRTQELQDMVDGLESFNANVSHDLRGPLGGMAGLARQAVKRIHQGDLVRALAMLDAVARQGDLLGALVSDLLSLARVGSVDLNLEDASLMDCVNQAIDQLHIAGRPTEAVELVEMPHALLDLALMRQVFVNLIGNALKFSSLAEQPCVRISHRLEARRIVVAVQDNGAGFPPLLASKLFKPFQRLHGKAYEGTGVGLTIVRRIVERHGGTVWAEGHPGMGATFYVALPRPGQAEPSSERAESGESDLLPSR